MGRAMNRSITNVLFGAFGQIQTGTGAALEDGRSARTTTPEDVAVMLSYARRVIFVPGYGLAVAQAQHDVRALADLLEEKGVDVRYAIHPVAGRMPGHMNVLLAEANVPYDQLFEMDEINPEMPQTDVAVVVGANDVVNPAARNDTTSPIYGMPIIDVDKAAQVVVVKRSLAPGFAGIDNPLFYDENDLDAVRGRKGGARAGARRREEPLAAVVPFFSARDVEAAVSPERAYEAVRDRVRRACARRVDDAAEALRHELSGRRLPRDAGARRRACAVEVGDLVPGQSGARAADRERGRGPLGRGDRDGRGAHGCGRGDRAAHGRGGGARRGDTRPARRRPRP